MTQLLINVGNVANDGQGTPLRTAFQYINDNFTELYAGTGATGISNGTSNVTVVSANGNITTSVNGTSNVAVFASTGEYVTGLISASGNIIGGNLRTAGLISATGNITGGNIQTAGLITATGNISGGNLNVTGNIVDTGALTIITGSNGNIALAPNGTGIVTASSNVSATGNVTGGNILTAGIVKTTAQTYATLPTAADAGAGARSFITDGNTATFGSQVIAGGANAVPVWSNGTNWYVG